MQVSFSGIDYGVMVVYLGLMVGLGLYFSKQEHSTEEYFLGNRKMPTFVIAVSMFVTLFSAISFVAVPGEAFEHGLSLSLDGLLAPIGVVIGFSLFVKFYFRLKSFTPFEYLERRYDRSVRLLISVVYMLMRLLYLGVVLYASAKAFKGAAGWPIWLTILIVGAVGVFYTTLGGMKAVVWTDFAQFLVLITGIGFVVYHIGATVDGGWLEVVRYAWEHQRGFEAQKTPAFFSFSPYERYTLWLLMLGMVANYTFLYGADQMTIQRLLSVKSYHEAKKATLINVLLGLPVGMSFWLIGIGLFAFYRSGTHAELPAGIHPNEVFSYFITTELAAPIPGLLISALLAAVMSTLDSGMNSLSAVFVKDVYKPFIQPSVSPERELAISRMMTFLLGALAMSFALGIGSLSENTTTSILEVAGLWGSLLGIVAGTFLLGVTTRRAHKGIIFVSAVMAIVTCIFLSVRYYYYCEVSERMSYYLVGSSPFIMMLLIGYPLCLLWPRRQTSTSIEGLTLGTFQRIRLDGNRQRQVK